jgi:hypothetical protein
MIEVYNGIERLKREKRREKMAGLYTAVVCFT